MSDIQLEIQKRFTLNWLIQGAAQHAGMTFHHLVRDELDELDPDLVLAYDQYAIINLLQYWQIEGKIFLGSPTRFWRRASTNHRHPFFGHPLLAKYGGMLAEAGRQRGVERAKEKGITLLPFAFSAQVQRLVQRLRILEKPHRPELVKLAKRTASTVWGIPSERLDAELCDRIIVQPGLLRPRNFRGALFLAGIVGYGHVRRARNELIVTSKGTNWQLLCKELVKGTADLICLHGLNQLDDSTYQRVIQTTDHIDLEPWMLQSGGEFWRRVIPAFPDDQPLAKTLMNLSRLPGVTLELLISEMIDNPQSAKARMGEFF
jgi:hypothetical protein